MPRKAGDLSLPGSFGWLTAAVLATLFVAGGVAWSDHGPTGLAAACVAAGVCWIGGALALVALVWWKIRNQAVAGVFSSIAIRTFLPLGVAVWLSARGGDLANAGVFGLIVVFYLVTLAVDTALAVRIINSSKTASAG